MKQLSKQAVRKGLLAVSAAALALVAGVAQAAPVSAWTFSTDTIFTASTFTAGGNGTQNTTPVELSWGGAGNFQTPGSDPLVNRSALTIGGNALGNPAARVGGGPVTGAILTDFNNVLDVLGEVGVGTSVTHWNNTLDGGRKALTGGNINDTLTLTPFLPSPQYDAPQSDVNAPTLNFNFTFLETPNSVTTCADGNAVGSFGPGCPDLIGFTIPTTNLPFQYFDSVDGFNRTYFASVLILGTDGLAFPIQTLTAGECAAIGLGAGCFGFRTKEEFTTTIQFAFAVTGGDRTVPEPASLALFGLALAGLGIARARKQG